MTAHQSAYPVQDVGEALEVMARARAQGLKVSYFPGGGDTAEFYAPITHRVILVGPEKRVDAFVRTEMENDDNNE